MFTGIIEEKGTVRSLVVRKNLCVLKIKAQKILKGLKVGDSVSVNGVCLTVTEKKRSILSFDIMKESLLKTTLKDLSVGCTVNLERALKVNGRLDGHFVTGHVDGIGRIKKRETQPNYVEFQITAPKGLMPFIAPKGSVSLDGVSLTIGNVTKNSFSVYLIPHTLEVTILGSKKEKEAVNIETDILAKYILNKRPKRT